MTLSLYGISRRDLVDCSPANPVVLGSFTVVKGFNPMLSHWTVMFKEYSVLLGIIKGLLPTWCGHAVYGRRKLAALTLERIRNFWSVSVPNV